jgi:predicted RNase H-like HicB family nuclease
MSATLVNVSGESLNKFNYSVLIEQEKEGSYKATVWGLPEIQAIGDTKQAALTSVQQLLTARLEKAEIVSKEIALQDLENPWIKFSGMYKDNPLFNDMVAEVQAYRRELDAEMEEYYRQMDAVEENK